MIFQIDTLVVPSVTTFSYLPDLVWGGARVFVENDTQGVGVIATADSVGRVVETPPFLGAAGDHIIVTFVNVGGERSALCVVLRNGQLDPNDRCP